MSMWGYDQTNIDYYQVVEVSASRKTVKIRPIAQRSVDGEQYMTDSCWPLADHFTVLAMVKRIGQGDSVRLTSYSSAVPVDAQGGPLDGVRMITYEVCQPHMTPAPARSGSSPRRPSRATRRRAPPKPRSIKPSVLLRRVPGQSTAYLDWHIRAVEDGHRRPLTGTEWAVSNAPPGRRAIPPRDPAPQDRVADSFRPAQRLLVPRAAPEQQDARQQARRAGHEDRPREGHGSRAVMRLQSQATSCTASASKHSPRPTPSRSELLVHRREPGRDPHGEGRRVTRQQREFEPAARGLLHAIPPEDRRDDHRAA